MSPPAAQDLNSSALPLDLSHVTIGILTALSEEYAVCRSIFDRDLTGTERDFVAHNGRLACWVCRVNARYGGQHLVAIARSPDMGNNSAAIAAALLLQCCPEMRYIIFCGIAGAVPHPQKPQDHVRLGDIVVTNRDGVIQYDFGKQRDSRGAEAPSGQGDLADPFAAFEWRWPQALLFRRQFRMAAMRMCQKRFSPFTKGVSQPLAHSRLEKIDRLASSSARNLTR